MTYLKKSYVEHTAVRVKDIGWHLRFFREALGMPMRTMEGSEDHPRQVWLTNGLQLISDPGFSGPEGRLAHLGIMTEDLEAAQKAVAAWGISHMPQGRNWFVLPDGLSIELLQATGNSVSEILAIDPRG